MENEKQVISVPNVYFDEEVGYFKFREPSSEEIANMSITSAFQDCDASDYVFRTFLQMNEANEQNYLNGHFNSSIQDFSIYLEKLYMSGDEAIDLFEGESALYHILPEHYYFDKLHNKIGTEEFLSQVSDAPFFAQTYYSYSISHGQTPQEFFAKFSELKQQNEIKANKWLEQKLNERTEKLQPQTQEFVEVAENIDQQVSESGYSRSAR